MAFPKAGFALRQLHNLLLLKACGGGARRVVTGLSSLLIGRYLIGIY